MRMPHARKDLSKAIEELIEQARLYRSCVTCTHFDGAAELCRFNRADLRPPAAIIAAGCDNYHEDPPF